MSQQLLILVGTAASIGLVHTLLGPDHYLPFTMLAKARNWSLIRTALVTFLCGLGHIAGSLVLGLAGIALGVTLSRLELIESLRGEIAGWLVIAFGLAYLTWGTIRAVRNKPHRHRHSHLATPEHDHEHGHHADHLHPHDHGSTSMTPWILFVIFVFGPCEPLVPLLMYPAAAEGPLGVAVVAATFGLVTILTMMAVVLVSSFGLSFLSMKHLERYSHALAGATILLCGVAIQLGL